jgi:hypothetical protein
VKKKKKRKETIDAPLSSIVVVVLHVVVLHAPGEDLRGTANDEILRDLACDPTQPHMNIFICLLCADSASFLRPSLPRLPSIGWANDWMAMFQRQVSTLLGDVSHMVTRPVPVYLNITVGLSWI